MGEVRGNRGLDMNVKIALGSFAVSVILAVSPLYAKVILSDKQTKDNSESIECLMEDLKELEKKKASKEEMERMFREYQEKIVARIEYSDKLTDVQLNNIIKALERIEKKQEKNDREVKDENIE